MEADINEQNFEENDKLRVDFRKPFTEKYSLIVETDSKAVNVTMQSKSQMRWSFRVINSKNNKIEVELIVLEHLLLETNNPIVKDLSDMSQVFGRMYSELHLVINPQGEILEILNLDTILAKWERTKQEMESVIDKHPEIKDVIILSDTTFQNPDNIKKAIQGSEFFMLHFHYIFGTPIPTFKKEVKLPNVLNTAFVDWEFNWRIAEENEQFTDSEIIVDLTAEPKELSEQWYQEAYNSFANLINIRQLRTSLSEKGSFRFEARTGKLLEAKLVKSEVADKELFCNITYTLTSEIFQKRIDL